MHNLYLFVRYPFTLDVHLDFLLCDFAGKHGMHCSFLIMHFEQNLYRNIFFDLSKGSSSDLHNNNIFYIVLFTWSPKSMFTRIAFKIKENQSYGGRTIECERKTELKLILLSTQLWEIPLKWTVRLTMRSFLSRTKENNSTLNARTSSKRTGGGERGRQGEQTDELTMKRRINTIKQQTNAKKKYKWQSIYGVAYRRAQQYV